MYVLKKEHGCSRLCNRVRRESISCTADRTSKEPRLRFPLVDGSCKISHRIFAFAVPFSEQLSGVCPPDFGRIDPFSQWSRSDDE
ncbi:hypothetical protein M407DRAFT_241697 [Tulasnella calospora MUT 4182]|uniref:Uncharacterized protein n=1 Tax=Tulasnella calospora MUT 4182 TaxID=1051891 RepID=A0A0C3QU02_9AGAM|nr:hypothetical protein M407DRAFT_241697 [Tulasnella calospora MUT 4182]